MADFAVNEIGSDMRDTRPGLIVCAFDRPRPGWDLVEDLMGRLWSPPGARTVMIAADQPVPLARSLHSELATPGVRGLLLVGNAEVGDEALIPLRALNRSADGVDRASDDGPGVVRSTAPAAEMIRALAQIGMVARIEPDGATGAGGYLLYQILASVPDTELAPSVGMVLLPPNLEPEATREAVKAAASAMATSLSPLPRAAFT